MPFNLSGTATYTTGVYGQAAASGRLTVSGVLSGLTNISMEIRVRAASAPGVVRVAIGQLSAAYIRCTAAGIAEARYGSGGTEVALNSTINVCDGAWHTVRLDTGPSGGRFYVDGVMVAQSATTLTAAGASLTTNPFGVHCLGGSSSFDWNGDVDEAAVWSAPPTAFGANYTPEQISNQSPNLVALWHLDGNLDDSAGVVMATELTLAGPSVGSVGVQSTNYTVTANGALSAANTVTPSDNGGGGTFSPTTVALGPGVTSGTFKYTPASVGTKTISITNTGGLTNPANRDVTVTDTTQAVDVENAALFWSPANWDLLAANALGNTSKCRQTTACGAYFKTRVSGTAAVKLGVDVSTFSGAPAANYPRIMWTVGNGPLQYLQLTAGLTSIVLANELTAAADVQVWLLGSVEAQGDRWGAAGVSPTNVLRITGLQVDPSTALSAHPMMRPLRGAAFGDSITEGVRAAGTTTQPADHGRSAAWYLQPGLDAEIGVCGYGSTGWATAGAGNMPAFPTHFASLSSGRARPLSGLDFIYEMHGFNGATVQATVQAWIATARAACGPDTWIFSVANPGAKGTAAKSAAVAAYKAANPSDTKVAFIDLADIIDSGEFDGPGAQTDGSIDDCHPLEYANALMAAGMTRKMVAAMGGASQLVIVGEFA
jgi:lysophospholipase L1-like esterase